MMFFVYPRVLLVVTFFVMLGAALVGDFFRSKRPIGDDQRDDLGVVLGAALTLLGLLIGFSFSMAISRYDQRKNYEEAEANAIGTEYLRADLLSAQDAVKVKALLRQYLEKRIAFYEKKAIWETDAAATDQIDRDTAKIQDALWQSVRPNAAAQPNPIMALAVSGMNDVLNSQGYTQAAWWNRIPVAAWLLMFLISMTCSGLIGYSAHRKDWRIYTILPVAVALSFFLIADIDSPRRGFITVTPQNLVALQQSLKGQ